MATATRSARSAGRRPLEAAFPLAPTRWTVAPGPNLPPPKMNPTPLRTAPPASWTGAGNVPWASIAPAGRLIRRIESVVPAAVSPPHTRISDPRSRATDRLRPAGSRMADRSMRRPRAAGTGGVPRLADGLSATAGSALGRADEASGPAIEGAGEIGWLAHDASTKAADRTTPSHPLRRPDEGLTR